MDFEDQLLLSRLDGFLDASSRVVPANEDLKCAASLVRGFSPSKGVLDSLIGFFSDKNVSMLSTPSVQDWISWLDDELSYCFRSIEEKLRFELVWLQVEMVRLLLDERAIKSVGKYSLSEPGVEAVCYALEVDDYLFILSFHERLS